MKQTAVDYFEDELKDKLGTIVINKNWELLEQIIKQAKEMEKEQIINAHGNKQKLSKGASNYEYTLTGEMYYNENFKEIKVRI